MPKLKTHKGMKKRFKISATGKVRHKPCGSSHLNSHKNGKKIRRLRKKATLANRAEARRIRFARLERQNVDPRQVEASKQISLHEQGEQPAAASGENSASASAPQS
ncbi:MAG: 50S ribosomal protein L35 [Isosphaeraceae bacterium]